MRGDSQVQETFLPTSADKQACNHGTECSNHHPSLSTLWSKGLSRSKIKWWAIYTHLLVNAIVRLSHPWSRDDQGQVTFLAPSAGKQACNRDTECSKQHPSLSVLRSKVFSCSKIKWWAIYGNLPVYIYIYYIYIYIMRWFFGKVRDRTFTCTATIVFSRYLFFVFFKVTKKPRRIS